MAEYNLAANLQIQNVVGIRQAVTQVESAFKNARVDVSVNVSGTSLRSLDDLNSRISAIQNNIKGLIAASTTASSALSGIGRGASSSLDALSRSTQGANSSFREIRTGANEVRQQMTGLADNIALAARRFVAFSVGAGTIVTAFRGIRAGISDALEFERAMVRLAQVSGETPAAIRAIEQEVSRLSTTLGVSSRELVEQAIVLKQAGLSAAETKQALQAIGQASLAPNFGNMKEITEGAISVLRQFDGNVLNLSTHLGAMNEVAGGFAVEASDLVEVTRRAGGAFQQTGGNLNELLGLFTSIRSTTRESADSIATGLRTIFSRLQRSDTVEVLKDFQIQLRHTAEEARNLGDINLEGQFVGGAEAIRRISEGLAGLRTTDSRYTGILEQLGGYRQISRVIPLIQQFGEAQRAVNVAQTGNISLQIAAERAQDSLLVKTQGVKEEYLALFRAITESNGFQALAKTALSVASGFEKVLEFVKPLVPLMVTLAGIKLVQSIPTAYSAVSGRLGYADAPRKFARGGIVTGGRPNEDSVHALLMPGEFVLPKDAAQRAGYGNLQRFALGGKRTNFSALSNRAYTATRKAYPDISEDSVPDDIVSAVQASRTAILHNNQEEYIQAMREHFLAADILTDYKTNTKTVIEKHSHAHQGKKLFTVTNGYNFVGDITKDEDTGEFIFDSSRYGEMFWAKKLSDVKKFARSHIKDEFADKIKQSKLEQRAINLHVKAAKAIYEQTGGGSGFFADGGRAKLAGGGLARLSSKNAMSYDDLALQVLGKSTRRDYASLLLAGIRETEANRFVPKGSEFIGNGIAALAFKSPDGDVLRLQPYIGQRPFENDRNSRGVQYSPAAFNYHRPNSDAVLQNTGADLTGNTLVERLPFVPSIQSVLGEEKGHFLANHSPQVAKLLQAKLRASGLYYPDMHTGNVGISRGGPKILDVGSLMGRFEAAKLKLGYSVGPSDKDLVDQVLNDFTTGSKDDGSITENFRKKLRFENGGRAVLADGDKPRLARVKKEIDLEKLSKHADIATKRALQLVKGRDYQSQAHHEAMASSLSYSEVFGELEKNLEILSNSSSTARLESEQGEIPFLEHIDAWDALRKIKRFDHSPFTWKKNVGIAGGQNLSNASGSIEYVFPDDKKPGAFVTSASFGSFSSLDEAKKVAEESSLKRREKYTKDHALTNQYLNIAELLHEKAWKEMHRRTGGGTGIRYGGNKYAAGGWVVPGIGNTEGFAHEEKLRFAAGGSNELKDAIKVLSPLSLSDIVKIKRKKKKQTETGEKFPDIEDYSKGVSRIYEGYNSYEEWVNGYPVQDANFKKKVYSDAKMSLVSSVINGGVFGALTALPFFVMDFMDMGDLNPRTVLSAGAGFLAGSGVTMFSKLKKIYSKIQNREGKISEQKGLQDLLKYYDDKEKMSFGGRANFRKRLRFSGGDKVNLKTFIPKLNNYFQKKHGVSSSSLDFDVDIRDSFEDTGMFKFGRENKIILGQAELGNNFKKAAYVYAHELGHGIAYRSGQLSGNRREMFGAFSSINKNAMKTFLSITSPVIDMFGTGDSEADKWDKMYKHSEQELEADLISSRLIGIYNPNIKVPSFVSFKKDNRFQSIIPYIDEIINHSKKYDGRKNFANGGAAGWVVPGIGNTDSFPADLPVGSFVIRKKSAEQIGHQNLARMASGGEAPRVPALLMPGEFVFGPDSAARIGAARLHTMNTQARAYALGGRVGFADGNEVRVPLTNTGTSSFKLEGYSRAENQDLYNDIDAAIIRTKNKLRNIKDVIVYINEKGKAVYQELGSLYSESSERIEGETIKTRLGKYDTDAAKEQSNKFYKSNPELQNIVNQAKAKLLIGDGPRGRDYETISRSAPDAAEKFLERAIVQAAINFNPKEIERKEGEGEEAAIKRNFKGFLNTALYQQFSQNAKRVDTAGERGKVANLATGTVGLDIDTVASQGDEFSRRSVNSLNVDAPRSQVEAAVFEREKLEKEKEEAARRELIVKKSIEASSTQGVGAVARSGADALKRSRLMRQGKSAEEADAIIKAQSTPAVNVAPPTVVPSALTIVAKNQVDLAAVLTTASTTLSSAQKAIEKTAELVAAHSAAKTVGSLPPGKPPVSSTVAAAGADDSNPLRILFAKALRKTQSEGSFVEDTQREQSFNRLLVYSRDTNGPREQEKGFGEKLALAFGFAQAALRRKFVQELQSDHDYKVEQAVVRPLGQPQKPSFASPTDVDPVEFSGYVAQQRTFRDINAQKTFVVHSDYTARKAGLAGLSLLPTPPPPEVPTRQDLPERAAEALRLRRLQEQAREEYNGKKPPVVLPGKDDQVRAYNEELERRLNSKGVDPNNVSTPTPVLGGFYGPTRQEVANDVKQRKIHQASEIAERQKVYEQQKFDKDSGAVDFNKLVSGRAALLAAKRVEAQGGVNVLAPSTVDKIYNQAREEELIKVRRELLDGERKAVRAAQPLLKAGEDLVIAHENLIKAEAGLAKVIVAETGGFNKSGKTILATSTTANAVNQAGASIDKPGFFRRGYDYVNDKARALKEKFFTPTEDGGVNPIGLGLQLALPYIGAGVERLGGDVEIAAKTGETGVFNASRGISGGISGGLIGGVIASAGTAALSSLPAAAGVGPFAPAIIAVSALTGAVYGVISSLKDADKEIRQVKINEAMTIFSDRLQVLSNLGSTANGQVRIDALNNLGTLRREGDERSRKNIGFFGNTRELLAEQSRGQRQDFGGQLAGMIQFLSKEAEEIGKTNLGQSLNDLETILRNGSDGLNREFIQILSDVRNVSKESIYKDLRKSIEAGQRQEQIRVDSRRASRADVNLSTLGRLESSTRSAIDDLRPQQTLFRAGLDGNSPVPVNFGVDRLSNLSQLGDNPGLQNTLGLLGNVFGLQGQAAARIATTANRVSSALPDVLIRARGQGAIGETSGDFVTRARSLLTARLGVAENVRQDEQLSHAINEVIRGLNDLTRNGLEDLNNALTTDSSALSENLVSRFTQPVQRAAQALQLFGDQQNQFITNLQSLNQEIVRAAEFANRAVSTRIGVRRTEADFSDYNRFATPGSSLRNISIGDLTADIQHRQEQLTGRTGVDARNPELIGRLLSEARREETSLITRQSTEVYQNGNVTQTAEQLNSVRLRMQNYVRALETMTDATRQNAAITERLNAIEQERQGRLNYVSRFATSNPEQRNELNQGVFALIRAYRQGSFEGFSAQDIRGAEDTGRAFQNQYLPALGVTGGTALNNLYRNTPGFQPLINGPAGEAREVRDLQGRVIDNGNNAAEANRILGESISDNVTRLTNDLRSMQSQFFAQLNAHLRRGETQGLETRAASLTNDRVNLNNEATYAQSLSRIGVRTNTQYRDAQTLRPSFASLFDTDTALNNASVIRSSLTRRSIPGEVNENGLPIVRGLDNIINDFRANANYSGAERIQRSLGSFLNREAPGLQPEQRDSIITNTISQLGGVGGIPGGGTPETTLNYIREAFENSVRRELDVRTPGTSLNRTYQANRSAEQSLVNGNINVSEVRAVGRASIEAALTAFGSSNSLESLPQRLGDFNTAVTTTTNALIEARLRLVNAGVPGATVLGDTPLPSTIRNPQLQAGPQVGNNPQYSIPALPGLGTFSAPQDPFARIPVASPPLAGPGRDAIIRDASAGIIPNFLTSWRNFLSGRPLANANGGLVGRFNSGGHVGRVGTSPVGFNGEKPDPSVFTPVGTDTVPAILPNGSFVIKRSMAEKHRELLDSLASGYNSGGSVVQAMLTPGEHVVSPSIVKHNLETLHAINNGQLPRFARGGVAYLEGGQLAIFNRRIPNGGIPRRETEPAQIGGVPRTQANRILGLFGPEERLRALRERREWQIIRQAGPGDIEEVIPPVLRPAAIRPGAGAIFNEFGQPNLEPMERQIDEIINAVPRERAPIGGVPRTQANILLGLFGPEERRRAVAIRDAQLERERVRDNEQRAFNIQAESDPFSPAAALRAGENARNDVRQRIRGGRDITAFDIEAQERARDAAIERNLIGGQISGLRDRQLEAQGNNPFARFGISRADSATQTSTNLNTLQSNQRIRDNFKSKSFILELARSQREQNNRRQWESLGYGIQNLFGFGRANGGLIQGFADGGVVPGSRTGPEDTNAIRVSGGEYVMPRRAVENYGVANFDRLKRFAEGGFVGNGMAANGPAANIGGVNGLSMNGPGVNQDIMQQLASNMGTFSSASVSLISALASFGSTAQTFARALEAFPSSLNITGSQQINVVFNGAEVFSSIQGDLKEMISEKTKEAIRQVFKDNLPAIGINLE